MVFRRMCNVLRRHFRNDQADLQQRVRPFLKTLRYCRIASFLRAFTAWLGGMGIIVIFVALLPAMGVSGYQLFSAEVSGPTADRMRPRIGETAKLLWFIYLIITASMILMLFVAACHFLMRYAIPLARSRLLDFLQKTPVSLTTTTCIWKL